MKDKYCFSKTFLFLVLVGVAVVLGVMTMNRKNTTQTEALGIACTSSQVGFCQKLWNVGNTWLNTGAKCTAGTYNGNPVYTWEPDTASPATCPQQICKYNDQNVIGATGRFRVGASGCVVDYLSGSAVNAGAQCVPGKVLSQPVTTGVCAKAAAPAKACYFNTVNVDTAVFAKGGYGVEPGGSDCIIKFNNNAVDPTIDYTLTGYKCVTDATTSNRSSHSATNVNDVCYVAPASNARTACYVGSLPVGATRAAGYDYTLDASNCILYKGTFTGLVCDPSTFKNTFSSTCRAPSECKVLGRPVASVTGYSMTGNCLQYNSKNTGFKCDSTTKFSNVYDKVTCPLTVATCDPSLLQKCKVGNTNYDYNACVPASGGYSYTCQCDTSGRFSYPTLVGPNGVSC